MDIIKIKAFITYFILSIVVIFIETIFGVSLNFYYYLDVILEIISEVLIPMLPTSGNWADSTNDAISITNMMRFFLRIMISPIPFVIAIIVYYVDNKQDGY